MQITALSTLRKQSGNTDYSVELCFGRALDPAQALIAGAWLQAHIMAENDQLLALTRSEQDIWLVRGVRETGTDNSGRQLHRLWFGLLSPGLGEADPGVLARTLFGCYQKRIPPLPLDAETHALPKAQMEPRLDDFAANAAVILLTTEEPFATVPAVEPALAVAELIGMGGYDHFVMSRRGVPPVLPPGRALVISAADGSPMRVPPLAGPKQLETLRAFDLRRLASTVGSPLRRGQLLQTAMNPDLAPPDALGDDELDWLLAIAPCRKRALQAASGPQLERLVSSGVLRAEEWGAVADRLTPAARAVVARQIAGQADALDRFVAWFGRGAEGIETLLPPDAAAAWADMHDPVATRPFAALFERAGLLDRLTVDLPLAARITRAWAGALDHAALLRLLERAECSAPAALLALLTGAPPPFDAVKLVGDLPSLVSGGVIGPAGLVAAVLSGWPIALLAVCPFDRESLALVTGNGLPPRSRPVGWDETLLPLLRRAVAEPWFWQRWPEGVPVALAAWLHAVLEPAPEANVTAALLAAQAGGRPLTPDEFALLVPALSREAVAQQVVLWGGHDRIGRTDILNRLLAAPCLTSELSDWLRGELMSSRPSGPPPELPAALMTALLPLLHPQRDVIRRVLARPQVEPGEDRLLTALVTLLSRTGFGLPMPLPDPADRRRRPDWIIALSRLPGWEHWRLMEGEGPR